MSVPVGAQGIGKPQSDLDVALGGGRRFADRLQQLADAKDAHDEAVAKHEHALNELSLGRAAVDAFAGAQEKMAKAEASLVEATRQAEEIKARARREAGHIVTEATNRAIEIEGNATKAAALTASQATQEAEVKLMAAEADMAAMKETAEWLHSDAADKHSAASAVRAEADNAVNSAKEMLRVAAEKNASLLKLQNDTESLKANLESVRARLTDVLKEL